MKSIYKYSNHGRGMNKITGYHSVNIRGEEVWQPMLEFQFKLAGWEYTFTKPTEYKEYILLQHDMKKII